MPVITSQALVAKNKAGNGLRNNDKGSNKANREAIKKLVDLLRKAGPELAREDEAIKWMFDSYADNLNTVVTTSVNDNTRPKVDSALNRLGEFNGSISRVDTATKRTGYDSLISVLPAIGSSKAELDSLLNVANGVLELGLEKTVLKPFDPQEEARRAQERQQQEQERQRREQERQRLEQERRQQLEEQARIRREAEERQRQEQERIRLEQERIRQEEIRRREEELKRQEEARQRKEQRVQDIKNQREAFLKEDYENTNYESQDVDALKIEPDYKERAEAIEEAEKVLSNENILDGEKEQFRRRLNDDALNRRRQEKEEAELLAEDAAEKEQPLSQTKTVMISESLRESFYKRYPASDLLTATDASGNEYKGTEKILETLAGSNKKLFISIPTDGEQRCTCLQGEEGKLLISKGPVVQGYTDADMVTADPEPGLAGDFERFVAENGIESAVGEDGTVYTRKDDMLNALYGSSKLMLFGKDKEYAFAVKRFGDSLMTTERADQMQMEPDWVSPDRVPENKKLFGIKDSDIAYAVGRDGKRFETPEAIREEIKNGEGLLRVYTLQDKEAPYVMDYKNGFAAVTKYPVHESQIDKLTDDDYEGCAPEEIEEKYILNWKESDVAFAMDANGKRYNTPEEIKLALYGEDKTLQVYTREKGENGEYSVSDLPYAVEKKNGRFFISPEKVPKYEDQMKALGEQLSGMDDEAFEQAYKTMDAKQFLANHWNMEEMTGEAVLLAGIGFDFKKSRIDFALDENGKLYESPEDMIREFDKPDDKTLFVFDSSGDLPYAIQKKDGLFYKSDEPISTRNILPDSYAFTPAKSLKADELGNRTDATEYFALKDQKDDAGKKLKYYNKEIERLTGKKNAGTPKPPQTPVKPHLGAWNTFVRGLKKVVTFGFGDETDAYKEYSDKKRIYLNDLKTLPERQKEFELKSEEYKEFMKTYEADLKEAEAGRDKAQTRLDKVNSDLSRASGGLSRDDMDSSKRKVIQYRDRIEAKLEAVKDLREKGRITPDNIFANTWLKGAQCKGKPASDPKAREALYEHLASGIVQDDILDRRFLGASKQAQTSDALDERKVEPLNNGKAVEALRNDKDLQDILNSLRNEPINPGYIKRRYAERVAFRERDAARDSNVLSQALKTMEKEFGQQEPSEKAFDEIIRYKTIIGYITSPSAKYDNVKKGLGTVFAMKPTEEDKKQFREAFEAVKAEGKGPMGLKELNKAINEKYVQIEDAKEAQAQNGGPQNQL